MKLTRIAATAVILAGAAPAWAQQLYRCGNTYSQTPCASDAKPARISSGAAPDKPQTPSGKELCAAQAPRALRFPDPESTRIISVTKSPAEVIQYAGQPMVAHKYTLVINAKNTYGAYAGEQPYSCYLSEDQARILRMEPQQR